MFWHFRRGLGCFSPTAEALGHSGAVIPQGSARFQVGVPSKGSEGSEVSSKGSK